MNYSELKEFISEKMRMSHIYQPVMIKKLLRNRGVATDKEIAEQLLQFDPSQIEYYQNITNKMVGKVLRNRNVVEKDQNQYSLLGFNRLSNEQIKILSKLCDEKIEAYIKKRGDTIWKHRKISRDAIPGTIRYEVLKRAHFRCELCGASADNFGLEVDHINPVSKGGPDDINNYQALCYKCNSSKGNRDTTDLRGRQNIFMHRQDNCIFCSIDKNRIVEEDKLSYIIYDKYPVTYGHCLIIPKRHFENYFDITQPEINSIHRQATKAKQLIQQKDKTIKGFNIGINSGAVAGQTIFHTHIHLIPRRENDVENPIGGIRNIIPNKGKY